MATVFNTQVGNGKYCLQFETDNKAHYLIMQSSARRCVDCEHMTNMDGCCGMMLSPTIWTNIAASVDRLLIGR